VAEPLEEISLSLAEINSFMISCYYLVNEIPSSNRHDSVSGSGKEFGAGSTANTPTSTGISLSHHSSAPAVNMIGSNGGNVGTVNIIAHNSMSSTNIGGGIRSRNNTLFTASTSYSSSSSRTELMKKDWFRFVTFARLCLFKLV
jgi:hypothetical protein